jgi:hypothetical protein
MKAARAIAVGSYLAPALALGLLSVQSARLQSSPKEVQPDSAPPVECRWVTGPIELDGVVGERSWSKAELVLLRVPWEKRKAKTATVARLLWDWDYLYFSAEMVDHDIFADIKDANGRIWENDSVGLFVKPSGGNLAYYQFMVNAASTPLQVYFPSRGGGGFDRFAAQTELTMEGMVKLDGTLNDWTDKDKGWAVEARIPWSTFKATGGRPKAGERWQFAFCRHDYSVTLDRPELSTNAPLTRADFHRYEEYQEVVFVARQ